MIRTLCPLATLVALLTAPGFAAAQDAASDRPLRNAVSVSIGLFRPGDGVFRRVYGSRQVPVCVDASHRVWRAVSVFGGVRHSRASGRAQPLGSGVAPEENAVRLSTLTGRAGAVVALSRAGWGLEAGVGATIGRYAESWPGAPALAVGAETGGQVRTTRIGALLQLAVSRSISRRLAVVGRVDCSFVGHALARQGSATVPRTLGGVESAIGLRVRF